MPAGQARRRGTPKIVPIVVSAGLAVGTFCGLLFGLGTPHDSAPAAQGSKDGAKPDGTASKDGQGGAKAPDDKKPDQVAAGAVDAGAAPADAAQAVVVTPDAGAPAVAKARAVLTFKVVPAVPTEITVDGEKVAGDTFEVELEGGSKTVKVVAKASGYKTVEKEFSVTKDMSVPLPMRKRGTGGAEDRPRPPGKGPIIDL
jgi:hypothetical protein